MGVYSTADLVYGIPIEIDLGDDSEFYDEEESWADLPGSLSFHPYGHYEDTDTAYAVLTTSIIQSFGADCWTAKRCSFWELTASERREVDEEVRATGIAADFSLAGWYLVASVG